jgi:hypothetical protein
MAIEQPAVARPADANLGPIRARRPDQVAEIRRLRRGGASVRVIAEEFGISVRTAYRYLAHRGDMEVVEVRGWRATFEILPGTGPRRVSGWRRA